MARGLLDMPEVVMSKIIKDIGIKEILTLRKVCHDLRDFIDDAKPYANLEEITISVRGYDSTICIRYQFSGRHYYVEYQQQMEGCLVRNLFGQKKILLKNEDFITVSMKDFEIVLGHQKLNEFMVAGDIMDVIVLEKLQRILSSRVHPLKVEEFIAENMNQSQLMSILPFLDWKTLSKLTIFSTESPFLVDQLVNLDQWKNSKQLYLRTQVDFEYIQCFTHFSTDKLYFRATHFPDLVSLKDLYLQSSGFKSINIELPDYDLDNVQQSIELLGEAFFEDENEDWKKWYYRIPATTEEVLEICVHKNILASGTIIELSRIDESDVPDEAVIQD